MDRQSTRWGLTALVALAAGTTIQWAAAAEAPSSIRIGYVLPLTGANAQGAVDTTLPSYKVWVHDVNERGGIMVREFRKRFPIEVVEYDDTSNADAAVRLTEKLMTEDKVDFVLPPWSTAFNVAVAPVYASHGYPQLAVTAVTDKEDELVQQFPTIFFLSGRSSLYGAALVEVLTKAKAECKINNKIVMLNVVNEFGSAAAAGITPALKQAGFDLVVQKSYPLGVEDLGGEIKEAKHSGADTFVAFSYPPDTFMLAGTAMAQGYNPKVFYTAVGTAFAEYASKFKEKAQGVFGTGGWNPDLMGAHDYEQRMAALTGHAPDGWASPVTYASLQVLERAIEKAGTLDRRKVLEVIANGGPWQTVVGPVDLKDHVRGKQFGVGQWQNGRYVGVAPGDLTGAQPVICPKPAW
jgi:branched-chain amino acid transport system substrate-binding protein